MTIMRRIYKPLIDFLVTFILWFYFTIGFLPTFMPIYFISIFIFSKREIIYQYLNHTFFKIFFFLIKVLAPGQRIHIDKEIYPIKSSIIICNHRSYLDSILLVSIFKRHKTLVKGTFFKIPIFRRLLQFAGYIPIHTLNDGDDSMVDHINKLKDFFNDGGNLFIFPEGTRSRDGSLGTMKRGAFSIAKFIDVPIEILYIENSEKLFPPGKLLLNTCVDNTITLQRLGRLHPVFKDPSFSIKGLRKEVLQMYNERIEVNYSKNI